MFMLTDWDILRLVSLVEKVHILKGVFLSQKETDTHPDMMLKAVYDVTDIRQVVNQTVSTIEHLAAVVKICGSKDEVKLNNMLLAVFGNSDRV